jgi:hypothetical protein
MALHVGDSVVVKSDVLDPDFGIDISKLLGRIEEKNAKPENQRQRGLVAYFENKKKFNKGTGNKCAGQQTGRKNVDSVRWRRTGAG